MVKVKVKAKEKAKEKAKAEVKKKAKVNARARKKAKRKKLCSTRCCKVQSKCKWMLRHSIGSRQSSSMTRPCKKLRRKKNWKQEN